MVMGDRDRDDITDVKRACVTRAIEQNNSGVGDHPTHAGVCHILVEHNSIKHFALFLEATRDLFNLGVPLGVDFNIISFLLEDNLHGLDCHVNN